MGKRLRRRVLVLLLGLAATVGAVAALALAIKPAALPSGGPPATAAAVPTPDCQPAYRRFGDDPSRATWFTLRDRSDVNGVITGNVVRVARAGGGSLVSLELPVEAFADGPYDEGALVGSDDGETSVVRFLAPRGCGRVLRTATDVVVHRATISPDGRWLITQHLERGTRADRGVWSAPIGEPDRARPLLAALAPDDRFGVTWGTTFQWSADGDRLVVDSCSPSGCRIQIVEPAGEDALLIDDPGLGESVGVIGDRLIAFRDCMDFRPCPLLERNLVSGAMRELHPEVVSASVVARGERTWLIASIYDRGERLIRIDLASGAASPLALPPLVAGYGRVMNSGWGAVGLPPGWIALAPEGRLPDPGGAGRVFAFDVENSRLLTLLGGNP